MAGQFFISPPQSGGSTGSVSIVPYTVGPIDTAPANPNGGLIGSNTLFFQSATATFPGLVSSASQVFSGVKTFSNGIVSSVTGHASLDLALVGGTMSGAINMGSNKVTSVTDPTSAQDAATKNYVDTQLSAFQPLESSYAATTTNLVGTYLNGVSGVGATFTVTATGAFTLDGTTPPVNSRILIKDQSTGFQNGVYDLTVAGTIGVSPILTRSLDYNTAASINAGDLVPVINGTINQRTSWIQTATVSAVGVDSLVFTQYSANPQNLPSAMGPLDGASASPNGASIGSSSLYLQSASATNPGIVSSANQTFAGVKTFSSAPNLSSLTQSLPLQLDGSKNIISQAIGLNTSQVSGNLPLSQTSGSVSFSQLRPYPQLTIGSVTQTSSVGGAVYTVSWPGAQGALNSTLLNDSAGNLSWGAALTNPATTSGDILVSSGSGVLIRSGVGSDGTFLKADKLSSANVKYDYTYGAASTKTAAYTMTPADGAIFCSSASYAITLCSLSGTAGKVIYLQKSGVTSSSTNVSIQASSASFIGGTLLQGGVPSIQFINNQDYLELVSDGTNWLIKGDRLTSKVHYQQDNGFGSDNTKIKKFTNVDTINTVGNCFQVNQNNGSGFSVLILVPGTYAFTWSNSANAADFFGLSINSNQLTTNMGGIGSSSWLAGANCTAADAVNAVSWQGRLNAGDYIRPHASGTAASTVPERTHFWGNRL